MSDDDLREIFAALGAVTIRRMFSGKGVYVDGVIVAIEYDDELRLKADSVSAPDFAAAGASQWIYHGHRSAAVMPYWSIPDERRSTTRTSCPCGRGGRSMRGFARTPARRRGRSAERGARRR